MAVSSKPLQLSQPTSTLPFFLQVLAAMLGVMTILTTSLLALSRSLPGDGQIAVPIASNVEEPPAIYLMDVDRRIPYLLYSDNSISNRNLAWSPDGMQVAFTSSGDRNGVYVMDADGANIHRLSEIYWGWSNSGLTWSPDGEQIAFISRINSNLEIEVVNVQSGAIRNLTNNSGDDQFPAWSPDGSQLAFISNHDGRTNIYVMDSDGNNIHRLTDDNRLAQTMRLAWSPDGTQIAFVSYRTGGGDVYTINSDGTHLSRLTDRSGLEYDPAWSPDGSKIAFLELGPDGMVLLASVNAGGGSITPLTAQPFPCEYDHVAFAWSNDGQRIAFGLHGTDGSGIYVMNSDGSNLSRLFYTDFHTPFPVWRP